jgi:hypothetical protein
MRSLNLILAILLDKSLIQDGKELDDILNKITKQKDAYKEDVTPK